MVNFERETGQGRSTERGGDARGDGEHREEREVDSKVRVKPDDEMGAGTRGTARIRPRLSYGPLQPYLDGLIWGVTGPSTVPSSCPLKARQDGSRPVLRRPVYP